MNLCLVQTDIAWEEPNANLKAFGQRIRSAAEQGADLIVLPEMSATGYSLRPEKIAEQSDGPIFRNFRAMAQQYGVALCFGVATTRGGKFYNSLFVVNKSGDLVYSYDKIHPFSFTGEDRLYTAGDSIGSFQLSADGPRISGMICYDLRFPELFTATAAACDLYLVIANWPAARAEHWKLLLRSRALDSLAYVAGVNRIGQGGKLEYSGDSAVVGPWGEVLTDGASASEDLHVEVLPERVRKVRESFTLHADRREFRVQTPAVNVQS